MFEYHGWAVVRSDCYEEEESALRDIVGELQRRAVEFNHGSGMTDIRWINGACFVSFAGHPNHRHGCIYEWFQWLAKHAPGSYGLLYVRDDESPDFNNEFRVTCLRRGQVTEGSDAYLSPCIPMIEADEPG